LFRALPHTGEADVIGRQLLRAATSVGANYRAACRARSRSEFVAKLGIVLEEADETIYWLELLSDNEIVQPHRLADLLREAEELTAILAAARKTIRTEPQIVNRKS
jgi:four helix bundle protein